MTTDVIRTSGSAELLSSLPTGWMWTTLGKVTESVSKVNPQDTPDEEFIYLDISSINNATNRITDPKIYKGLDAPSRARQLVNTGDVLFSTVRTYLRNIAPVPEKYNGQIASTGFAVLRGNPAIVPGYLLYYVLTDGFLEELGKLQRGVSYPAVREDDVRSQPIPLAPLAEQKRIVDAIEAQFTRLDAAVAGLQRLRANLQRYRQSVLKAACEGRLVPTEAELARAEDCPFEDGAALLQRILAERRRQWEADNRPQQPKDDKWKAKYRVPAAPDVSSLPDLPDGWSWASLDQATECLDRLRVPINKKERAEREGDYPYYGANGQVGWIDDYLFDEPLVLVVEDETFTGRQKPFSYKIKGKTWVNNHAHVLRPSIGVDVDYLNYSLAYYPFTPLTTGTTGRKKLTQAALLFAPYALPPLAEQERIVEEVERRLSVIEQHEQVIAASLKRAERLRQSILKRAFAGQLV